MPGFKLKQLQYEQEMWKRLLDFISDENIHLKNRISEVLKNGYDRRLLEQLENFQTRFIKEDELISLLRNQVAELDKSVQLQQVVAPDDMGELTSTLNRLRGNIRLAEKQFGQLKLDFNNYLLSTMS